jgi:glycosyltransferase involved in cell wall biosynthesis
MRIADQVTAMVLTMNEEANIARCLDRLTWAKQVLIVDSGSTDGTLKIVERYRNARVTQRPFDDFASQCNFGLAQIETPWVLSLDADYELSEQLIAEIARLEEDGTAGYSAAFVYRMYGRPLRASLYPPRVVLYRRGLATYRNEGHGHRVRVEGMIGRLEGTIYHDDRKPLSRWFASQQRYARLEADHLLAAPRSELGFVDRLRVKGWPAPLVVFLYTLIGKRCLLDGWPGWFYALQRLEAETLLALEIVDRRLRGRAIDEDQSLLR